MMSISKVRFYREQDWIFRKWCQRWERDMQRKYRSVEGPPEGHELTTDDNECEENMQGHRKNPPKWLEGVFVSS